MSASIRQKIRGMFLGTGIGDALGLPAETMTPEQILRHFGTIQSYLPCPADHRFLSNYPAGTISDDTQLTLAVAEAVIAAGGQIDMDQMVAHHILSYEQTTAGWGQSTKLAVRRLRSGAPWTASADTSNPKLGMGNGVVMKLAPLGALAYAARFKSGWDSNRFIDQVYDFTAMTHRTNLAIISAFAHLSALVYCLANTPESFRVDEFARTVYQGAMVAPARTTGIPEIDFLGRIKDLPEFMKIGGTPEYGALVEHAFGPGRSYVLESLPFSYVYFLGRPDSFESVLNVINAGGDTDSNGSIVGGLLGALHGTSIFPTELVTELRSCESILDTADRFVDCLKLPTTVNA